MLDKRLGNCGCVDFDKTDLVIKEVDELAAALKKEIIETKDEIAVSGKCYYVSENGNDSNNGLSKEFAIKTINKVNSLELLPGDGVFFERGGIFRGNLFAKSGVTYAAYGEGRKPKIYGSPEDGADASRWTLVDGTDNIWLYNKRLKDVGVIIYNNGENYSVKKIPSFVDGKYVHRSDKKTPFDIKKDMNLDLCHFCRADFELDGNGNPAFNNDTDLSEVYVRCDKGNPGEIFKSIEFAVKPNVISVGKNDNVHIDNLAIMYGGSHGVSAGTCMGLHVTNCEIGWIGGGIQFYCVSPEKKGEVIRFGNGIEVYGGCDDYICDHNYIYQCYDAGATHQLSAGGTQDCKQKNIKYINNLIEYCTYSYEYFLGKPASPECIRYQQNVLVKDNIMRYAGFGFGEQRPGWDTYFPAAHIKGWDHANFLDENYVIEDNIFDRGRNMIMHCCAVKGEYLPTFRNNIYIQYKGEGSSYFGRYGVMGNENNVDIPYGESIREVMNERKLDADGGVYFARRDRLFDLPDYLPKHDRG